MAPNVLPTHCTFYQCSGYYTFILQTQKSQPWLLVVFSYLEICIITKAYKRVFHVKKCILQKLWQSEFHAKKMVAQVVRKGPQLPIVVCFAKNMAGTLYSQRHLWKGTGFYKGTRIKFVISFCRPLCWSFLVFRFVQVEVIFYL